MATYKQTLSKVISKCMLRKNQEELREYWGLLESEQTRGQMQAGLSSAPCLAHTHMDQGSHMESLRMCSAQSDVVPSYRL